MDLCVYACEWQLYAILLIYDQKVEYLAKVSIFYLRYTHAPAQPPAPASSTYTSFSIYLIKHWMEFLFTNREENKTTTV